MYISPAGRYDGSTTVMRGGSCRGVLAASELLPTNPVSLNIGLNHTEIVNLPPMVTAVVTLNMFQASTTKPFSNVERSNVGVMTVMLPSLGWCRSTCNVLVAPTMTTWYPLTLCGVGGPSGAGAGGGNTDTTPAVDFGFSVRAPSPFGLSQQHVVVDAVQL